MTPYEGDVWDEETRTLTINSNPGERAYADYENEILHLIVGKDVTEIGKYAFDEYLSLSTIEYEEGSKLEIIGKGAFGSCALTSVTIPNSVTFF